MFSALMWKRIQVEEKASGRGRVEDRIEYRRGKGRPIPRARARGLACLLAAIRPRFLGVRLLLTSPWRVIIWALAHLWCFVSGRSSSCTGAHQLLLLDAVARPLRRPLADRPRHTETWRGAAGRVLCPVVNQTRPLSRIPRHFR